MTEDSSNNDSSGETAPVSAARIAVIGPNRRNSLLTSTNREFLTGYKEYDSRQRRYEQRKAIRERVIAGLRDLPLLIRLEQKERERILDELDEGEFERDVSGFIEFVYEMLEYDTDELENIITSAVSNAEQEREKGDRLQKVTTTIDVDHNPDPEAIYERFQKQGPHTLSPAEIGILVRKGLLDSEEIDILETPFGSLDPERPYPYPVDIDEDQ